MATSFPTIKAYNPELLRDVVQTDLSADAAAGASTVTVSRIAGIGVGDYLLFEEFGSESAEIRRVSTSTAPSGSTVTLNDTLVYAHTRSTRVWRIDRNQVEFSRATTLTGAKSVLATSDITPDSLYTVYEDQSNTTGFGFYRWYNSADSVYTGYSESYPYAGYGEQTLKKIFDSVLSDMGLTDDQGNPQWTPKVSRSAAFQAVVDCQDIIARRRYRWSYLTNFDVTVAELATGQDSYALPTNIARENGNSMVLAARIGGRKDLKIIDKRELNRWREETVKTTLGAAITSTGNTTVTLADSSDFDDSGDIQVISDDGESIDVISYTSNNRTTNVLSGVTGIAATVANGAIVWQGATFGEPKRITFFEDAAVVDPPPTFDWEQYNLILDLYERPTVVDDLADEAQFPATVIKPYVKYKLDLLRYDGDESKASGSYNMFKERLAEIEQNENNGQQFRFVPNRKPNKIESQRNLTSLDDTSTTGTS